MTVTAAKAVRSVARDNIWTVPETLWRNSTREAMWKFESLSATGTANNIVIHPYIHPLPFSQRPQRIAKELPSAQYLDCELRSPL